MTDRTADRRRYRGSRTKSGSSVRGMVDVFAPQVSLLAKLGSIAVHVDEVSSADGEQLDWIAIRSLLADREVVAWLAGMDSAGLLPKKRA